MREVDDFDGEELDGDDDAAPAEPVAGRAGDGATGPAAAGGLTVPMDAVAVAHLERFVGAFPDASWQSVERHVGRYYGWALALPAVQARMAALVAAHSGQRPA